MARITRPDITSPLARTPQLRASAPQPTARGVNTFAGPSAASQIGGIIDQKAEQVYQASKKAHQSATLLNSLNGAQESFIAAQQERYKQVTDENGNPTFESLHSDIGDIGGSILKSTISNIKDPEVAEQFKLKFSDFVSNQKVSALKQGMKQQVQFGRASLDSGLESLARRSSDDDLEQLGGYELEGLDALESALEGGLISPEEHVAREQQFLDRVREGQIVRLLRQDNPQAARVALASLDLPETTEAKLGRAIDSTEKAISIQSQKAAEQLTLDQQVSQAQLVSEVETRIQADSLREDQLLALEGQLDSKAYNSLKKTYIEQQVTREQTRKKLTGLASRIAEGPSNFTDVPSKDVDQLYNHIVGQLADTSGEGSTVSMSVKAQHAAAIPAPVPAFSKSLDAATRFGSTELAEDALSAYTYIKDRNKPTLEAGFSGEAVAIMETTELLVEKAGMEPAEALQSARETVLNIDANKKTLRLQGFKDESAFELGNIEETAAEALGVDTFFSGNQISRDAAVTFRELAREGYLKTGSEEGATAYASQLMKRTHGISKVSGSEEFMFNPPEKAFPELNSDQLRSILIRENSPQLPSGADKESISIEADQLTSGQIQVLVGGERRNVPTWIVTYEIEIEGETVRLPLIDEDSGQALRWSPMGSTALEEIEAEKLQEAKDANENFRENRDIPEGVIASSGANR